MQMAPSHLHQELAADGWELPPIGFFSKLPDADQWGLLLTLVNWAAKSINESWYNLKDQVLIQLAAAAPAWLHVDFNVVYIEGSLAQYSFHYFSDEVEDYWREATRSPTEYHEWDGTRKQEIIWYLIWRYYREILEEEQLCR